MCLFSIITTTALVHVVGISWSTLTSWFNILDDALWASQVALGRTCLQCRRYKRHGLDPWIRKIPWRGAWQPILVFMLGESHGQRSLAGYSPWVAKSQTRLSNWTELRKGWEKEEQEKEAEWKIYLGGEKSEENYPTESHTMIEQYKHKFKKNIKNEGELGVRSPL